MPLSRGEAAREEVSQNARLDRHFVRCVDEAVYAVSVAKLGLDQKSGVSPLDIRQ